MRKTIKRLIEDPKLFIAGWREIYETDDKITLTQTGIKYMQFSFDSDGGLGQIELYHYKTRECRTLNGMHFNGTIPTPEDAERWMNHMGCRKRVVARS